MYCILDFLDLIFIERFEKNILYQNMNLYVLYRVNIVYIFIQHTYITKGSDFVFFYRDAYRL